MEWNLSNWLVFGVLLATGCGPDITLVHFQPIPGAGHFATLAPVTRLISGKIVRDTGSSGGLTFASGELDYLPVP